MYSACAHEIERVCIYIYILYSFCGLGACEGDAYECEGDAYECEGDAYECVDMNVLKGLHADFASRYASVYSRASHSLVESDTI